MSERPPPPPPPRTPTPPPRFDEEKMDAVTSYQLMVRGEVKDDMLMIQHAPSPPPPPPPPTIPQPPLPLYADNVGLIRSLYVSHNPTLPYRVMG